MGRGMKAVSPTVSPSRLAEGPKCLSRAIGSTAAG